MRQDEGGPAFPVAWPLPNAPEPGMSLRDYFATKAMGSIIAWPDGAPGRLREETYEQATARLAYRYADAMIAERAK